MSKDREGDAKQSHMRTQPAIDKAVKEFMTNVVGKKEFAIYIYHPMCGHCIAMKDEWKKSTEMMANRNVNIIVADSEAFSHVQQKFEGSDLAELMKKDFMGYPRISKVTPKDSNGTFSIRDFNKERTSANLSAFILPKKAPEKPVVKKTKVAKKPVVKKPVAKKPKK